MATPSFLAELLATGRVTAAAGGADAAAAVAALPEAIAAADAAGRLELPGEPPPLSMPAALWSATIFYHACRFLAYRQFEAQTVRAAMAVACPTAPSPSTAYSVDLTFRYLPDLIALARGIAEQDPLTEGLVALAAAFPLSSVGVDLPAAPDSSGFIADPCLRTLYVERIIQKGDVSRLNHPAVILAAREALGLHPELSPRIARALAGR